MSNAIFNELAAALATRAVRGDNTRLEKAAAALQLPYSAQEKRALDPMVTNALLGAGAGGLVGLLQPKRKGRNALTYGLLGGLTGAGLTAAMGGGAQAPAGDKQPAPPVPAADTAMVSNGSGAVDPRNTGFLGQLGLGAATARGTYKYLTNRWLNNDFGLTDAMRQPGGGKFAPETYAKGLQQVRTMANDPKSGLPEQHAKRFEELKVRPGAPTDPAAWRAAVRAGTATQLDSGRRGAVPFNWLESHTPKKGPGWTPAQAHSDIKEMILGARQKAQLGRLRNAGAFGLSGAAGLAASQAGRYLGEAGGNAWNRFWHPDASR
jgi:hypothetical protein